MAEGRDRVINLHSCFEKAGDLAASLARAGDEIADGSEVKVSVTAEGHAQTLDPLAADEIYCIGREAIVNAIRLPICGGVAMIPGPNQTLLLGARDVDMEHIASYLPTLASEGRPVVDGTGLTGTFDFSINWVSGSPSSASSATAAPLDNSGPTFEEALREQLGLKLKSVRAPVRTLVIDHVEPLSPN